MFKREKDNKPKLSIITVCYNEKSSIRNTCESVVGQTYSDFEWIVIDGGSTDGTLEILKDYQPQINKFVSEKDSGVYDAMNKGIDLAEGEYLLFLNGGDSLFSNDVLANVWNDNLFSGDVLYGNCCVLKKDGSSDFLDFPEQITHYYFLDYCINHQSAFIKKNLFQKYGYYDRQYRILSDYDRWLDFQRKGAIYSKIPFVISNFKFFDGLSSSEKNKKLIRREKRRILKRHFGRFEIIWFRVGVISDKIYSRAHFLVFSPRAFLKKHKGTVFNLLLLAKAAFLNSPLRQPARKVWIGWGFKGLSLSVKNYFGRYFGKKIIPKNDQDYNAINAIEALSYCQGRIEKVLVVGCNRGDDCAYFVRAGSRKVWGVDILNDIGKNYQHRKVRYLKTSAEDMKTVPDDYFDLVYCFATMEHIPDIQAAFKEMARVCKKGGIIYAVSAPLWHSAYGHHKKDLFEGYPWIHLSLDKEGIRRWFVENKSAEFPNLKDIERHIEYMLDSENFNKRKAAEYLDACDRLNVEIIINRVDRDSSEELTEETRKKLVPVYGEDELFGFVHRFVGKKK